MKNNKSFNILSNDFIIHEDEYSQFTVDNYLYGSCHLFALALSDITHLKIGAFLSSTEDNEGFFGERLEHAFCYHPKDKNLIIDARGIIDKEKAWEEYTNDTFEPFEVIDAKQMIKEWINNDFLHQWGENTLLMNYSP